MLSFFTGCSGPTVVSPAPAQEDNDGSTPRESIAESEIWEVNYIQDAKIGYSRTTTRPMVEDGRKLVEITNKTMLDTTRFRQAMVQRIVATSIESPAGEVVRFSSSGLGFDSVSGRSEDGKLLLEIETAGIKEEQSIPWDKSWGGYFAVDRSLQSKPMKPGERRTMKALISAVNSPCDIELNAGEAESVLLLDGWRDLLRIEAHFEIRDQPIKIVNWADDEGQILKRYDDQAGVTTYRTTKTAALRPAPPAKFDLGLSAAVRVDRSLEDPHATERIIYRARLPNGDPMSAFAAGPAQQLRRIDDDTAEITVLSLRPTSKNKIDGEFTPPSDADLQSNRLIQSDDPRIVALAQSVAGDEQDAWKLAISLEQLAFQKITKKNFSQAFVSAADVAENLEGDCTEHAVLLAALCRARKLPARIAIGLVYYPIEKHAGGFAYHMWTEVWIDDRWIPIDGTLGRRGTGAAHIKLTDSNLKGSDAFAAFLPVIKVIWQLELKIVEVE